MLAVIVYNIAAIVIAKQSEYKSPPKSQIIQYLKEQDQNINLPGELVYDNMKDEGCDQVNFGDAWYCTYDFKKSYKHSGSKDSDIQQAITALESAGCVRRYSEHDGEYNYSFSMSGASSCSVRVIIPDNEGIADIGNEKIIGLKDGEYVYEVYITRDYEHEN